LITRTLAHIARKILLELHDILAYYIHMEQLPLGTYRHYKGKEYEVIGVAKDSETLKDLVIYRGLYTSEEFGENPLWARQLEMFLEKVEVDGKKIKRFTKI
jgi:hypothetical protein